MKALRSLRILRTLSSAPHNNLCPLESSFLRRFYSAEPEHEDVTQPATYLENDSDSVFDSSHYEIPNISDTSAHAHQQHQPLWDQKYRTRADELISGKEIPQGNLRFKEEDEEEEESRRRVLAKALLEASLEKVDSEGEDESVVKEEDQKSLAVGIIGAPNAGKSALTNYMVGSLCYVVPT